MRREQATSWAIVTATVVAIALWLGAATPGVAAANESPSPPALATLIACNGARRPESTSVGGCPAIARGSSSAVHSPTTRRFPIGLSGPAGGLALVTIASVLVVLVAQVVRRAEVGAAGGPGPSRLPELTPRARPPRRPARRLDSRRHPMETT